MQQLSDFKPAHEAVVVERIYAALARTLVREFPHLKGEFSLTDEVFGQDEKTLITENPALKEELSLSQAGLNEGFSMPPDSGSASGQGEQFSTPGQEETRILQVGGFSSLTRLLLALVVVSLMILVWLLMMP